VLLNLPELQLSSSCELQKLQSSMMPRGGDGLKDMLVTP
jgi:hypothetical protein